MQNKNENLIEKKLINAIDTFVEILKTYQCALICGTTNGDGEKLWIETVLKPRTQLWHHAGYSIKNNEIMPEGEAANCVISPRIFAKQCFVKVNGPLDVNNKKKLIPILLNCLSKGLKSLKEHYQIECETLHLKYKNFEENVKIDNEVNNVDSNEDFSSDEVIVRSPLEIDLELLNDCYRANKELFIAGLDELVGESLQKINNKIIETALMMRKRKESIFSLLPKPVLEKILEDADTNISVLKNS